MGPPELPEPGSLNSDYYSYYSLLLLAWCLSSLQPVVREGQCFVPASQVPWFTVSIRISRSARRPMELRTG